MLKYVSTLRHVNRFVAVGVINTAVYYGLYLFLRTVIPYLAAHVIAIFIVMLGSFFLYCYWTFETPPTRHKLALFPFTNATNYLVTTFGVFVLVEWFGVDQRWAPLIAAAAAIPVAFVLSRWVLIGAHDPDPVVPATPGPLPE
jgi:putative flippase GtrA